ncbi:glycosyltransferase family 2 protein [Clostridium paridis]|uniref:Glycosyltransferase family 2 protein n=1 Tax=Clostridium paridis TaxID=2803863 RepID=A0A937K4G0_9CLOT|nr:glycosyltransferase family 2 protein [Clostridium paridis]MBL4932622.1 glycosyltransferase family 2 protein [Clostridium paridis]
MLVSVIIPAYNIENYIGRCIDSVLNQTYENIEILIINDGSTDNTSKVVKQRTSEKIRLIEQDNQGVSAARNNGINYSKGEIILFLDADDRIKPNYIEMAVKKINDEKCDICFCGWEVYDEDDYLETTYSKDGFVFLEKPVSGIEACRLKVEKYIWICQGTCLYRKDLLVNNNLTYSFGYAYGEDMEFINKALLNSEKVCSIAYNGFENLNRNGSAINSDFNEHFLDALYLNRNFYDYVEKKEIFKKSDIDSLLISIDNDYNNIMLGIYKRILKNSTIAKFNEIVKNKKLKLINLNSKYTLRTINFKWKIKYNVFIANSSLGAIVLKYFI